MKDLTEMIRLLMEASETANSTYESCTEHAKKTLTEEEYVVYLKLMSKQTDLLRKISGAGMLKAYNEMLASLNKIMEDGAKISEEAKKL